MNSNIKTSNLSTNGDWIKQQAYTDYAQVDKKYEQEQYPTAASLCNTLWNEKDLKKHSSSYENILDMFFPEIKDEIMPVSSQPQAAHQHSPKYSKSITSAIPNNYNNNYSKNYKNTPRRTARIAPKLHNSISYPINVPVPAPTGKDVAEKRQKNTFAARKSRLKKIIKMENLEKRVDELNKENSRLKTRIALLESENRNYISCNIELEKRLCTAESYLAEAQKALISKFLSEST